MYYVTVRGCFRNVNLWNIQVDYHGAAMSKTKAATPSLVAVALLVLAANLPASTPCLSFELSGVSAEEMSLPQSKADRDSGKVYDLDTRGLKAPVVIYSPRPDKDSSSSKTSPGTPPKDRKVKDATVFVEFTVDASGNVQDVKVREAPDRYFAKKAEEVIRTWRFKPATLKGKPVACRMFADVKFHRLDRGKKH
jgi:TonB family protein